MRSDRNASNRTKKWNNKKVVRKVERYSIIPFRSRLHRQMENMSTERLRSRLNAKQNWYAIFPFLCEQPICPFQKLERRWDRTIAFPCELGQNLAVLKHIQAMHFWRTGVPLPLIKDNHYCCSSNGQNV